MGKRGELTPEIKKQMEDWLGRETSQVELRLYPYLLYTMVNSQKLDPNSINPEERGILSKLRAEGHIEGGASGMGMSRDFFMWAQGIMFDTYVDID